MGQKGAEAVQDLVRILHLSRSDEEFGIVADLICSDLRTMGAKAETISMFYNTYCVKPTWHVAASGIPGITPDQNPQEAYNGGVKKRTKLLQPLAQLVHSGFQKLITYDSKYLTGPMAFKAPAVPDAGLLHGAAGIWTTKGQLYKVDKAESGVRVGVYVNSATHGTGAPVTKDRIRGLNAALAGRAPTEGMMAKDYAAAYMSLHLVELVDGVVRCDCKGFWHSLVCKHSLAAEHAWGMRNVLSKVKTLKGTKRGRGSKTPRVRPALVRQPRGDDSSDGDGGDGEEGSDGEQEPAAQPPPKRPRAHDKEAQPSPASPRGAAAASTLAQLAAAQTADKEMYKKLGHVIDDLFEKSSRLAERVLYDAMLTPSEVDAFFLCRSPAPQAGVQVMHFLQELEGAEIIVRTASETDNVVYIERGTPALLEAADAFIAEQRAAERRAQDATTELGAQRSLGSSGLSGVGGVGGRGGRGRVAGTRNGGGAAGGGRWQSRGEGARDGAKPRN